MNPRALLVLLMTGCVAARRPCPPDASLQQRVRDAPLVFRGLAVQADAPLEQGITSAGAQPLSNNSAQFWIISVYKGSRALAEFFHLDQLATGAVDIKDRKVVVHGLECGPPVTAQRDYLVLAKLEEGRLEAAHGLTTVVLNWTRQVEEHVWKAIGWAEWTDWTACSASCGGGSQSRRRQCQTLETCEGFNMETRKCNKFSCQGAVSLLSPEQRRHLHGQWGRAPDRQSAWRLRASAYLWLPAAELPVTAGHLRQHFALLTTLRLDPKEPVAGTLFSLRSRRQQNAYLSVELGGTDTVRLVHAGANGTQTVVVPVPYTLADGHWHHLALGVQQDSSVRSYLDCRWISTDILRRDALDIPEDADIVIGYLFTGDIEQLTVVPDARAVSQQCDSSRASSVDSGTADLPSQHSENKSNQLRTPTDLHSNSIESTIWQDDEDLFEGSAYEIPDEEWSKCSVTCGLGVQTRRVRCLASDPGLCTETRPCNHAPCKPDPNLATNLTEPDEESKCGCHNGGKCRVKSGRLACQCLHGYEGRRCEVRSCPGPCLHGGVCHNSGFCSCPPEYTGQTCHIPVCRPPCMNGGQCIKPGVCSCPTKFSSPRCASKCPACEPGGACVSPGVCECLPGFQGSLCQESLCPAGCLNGGTCSGPNFCTCLPGWSASDCSIPVCDPPCQRGGRCIGPHHCSCPPHTLGQQCQNFTCPGGCLNGGLCVGPALCECPANATGPDCARPLCDPPCENGAPCGPGNTCLCGSHTSGTRCQIKNCDYRFVQEPYTRGFRKLVKKRIKTECGSASAAPCHRTIAEYQTVYKTFYRTVYKCASDVIH